MTARTARTPRFAGLTLAVVALLALGLPAAAQDNAATSDVPIPHVAPVVPDQGDSSGDGTDTQLLDGGNSVLSVPDDTSGNDINTPDDATDSGGDMDTPDSTATDSGDMDGGSGDDLDGGAVAPEPTAVAPPADIRPGAYTLEARLDANGPPLGPEVKWRIFGDKPGADGHMPLLAQADGGIVYLRLQPGTYYVHAAYGRAGATRKIDVQDPTGGAVVVLNAGGMRLLAVNGKDTPLGASDVSFDVYAPDEGGSEERFVLIQDAPPGHVISLNAGTYQVVCKYGDANAIVRADIKVDPGKLTEATVFQNAARLTLKLVEQHGGEALANTAWTVETPAGKSVVESVGAFPSVVLAAGDYTAKAKHDGKVYQLNFSVAAGNNRDVEVLAE